MQFSSIFVNLAVLTWLGLLNSVASSLKLGALVRPLLPIVGWYAVANLPIYGIGEWEGKANGLGAMTEFSTLVNRAGPTTVSNEYIVAPRGVAPRARVVDPGVTFNVPATELYNLVDKIILQQDLVTPVKKDALTLRLEYVQRTPIFRFPDVITIQAVNNGEKSSKIAIHSYSIYGAGDLGTNRARVVKFLSAIQAQVPHTSS